MTNTRRRARPEDILSKILRLTGVTYEELSKSNESNPSIARRMAVYCLTELKDDKEEALKEVTELLDLEYRKAFRSLVEAKTVIGYERLDWEEDRTGENLEKIASSFGQKTLNQTQTRVESPEEIERVLQIVMRVTGVDYETIRDSKSPQAVKSRKIMAYALRHSEGLGIKFDANEITKILRIDEGKMYGWSAEVEEMLTKTCGSLKLNKKDFEKGIEIISRAYDSEIERRIKEQEEMRAESGYRGYSLEQVIRTVSEISGVKEEDLIGTRREARFSSARQVAMYLAREYTGLSLAKIGAYMSGRDHTTIIYGIEKFKDMPPSDRSADLHRLAEDALKHIRGK